MGGTSSRPHCSGGFPHDRLQPLPLGQAHDRSLGEDGHDSADAELHRLLDQPIEPVVADRGQDQRRPTPVLGRSMAAHDLEQGAAPADLAQARDPLAVTGVKDMDRIARAQAQDGDQMMHSTAVERQERPGLEPGVEEEPRHAHPSLILAPALAASAGRG